MILKVYNIRDERVGTFGTPIFSQLVDAQICDQYEATIKNLDAQVARLQEIAPSEAAKLVMQSASLRDSVIYEVGTFDNQSGVLSFKDPVLVCRLSDFFREVTRNA